jgi:tetratricopeptide (TPR) repeat protein
MRIYPYYSSGISFTLEQCYVSGYAFSFCYDLYNECTTASETGGSYPPYDPRCRSWYETALLGGDPTKVYFDYPRLASTGDYVLTSTTPIRSSMSKSGTLYGVLNFNVLSSTLSDSVNSVNILYNGYAYVVDADAPENVVIHSDLGSCIKVSCLEAFSTSEYLTFNSTVLQPLRLGTTVATTYTKGGSTWRLEYEYIEYGTIRYAVIVTVPNSDVLKATTDVQNSIDSTTLNLIIIFAVIMGVVALLMAYETVQIVRGIVVPLKALKQVCENVLENNLEGKIPSEATSRDMKVLLEAFGSMIIALRFGSDSYSVGDNKKARCAFEDALRLFTSVENTRGIGIAHNNLGAVFLSERDFAQASFHYDTAVANARSILENARQTGSSEQIRKAQKALSDRQGNLALLWIEEGKFPEAFDVIDEAIRIDESIGNTRGYVVKRGTLGQWYLKQGEMKDAQRTFEETLRYVRSADERQFDSSWNADELPIAEQIGAYQMPCTTKLIFTNRTAIFNLGTHALETGKADEAEILLTASTIIGPVMQMSTTKKALVSLRKLFEEQGRTDHVKQVAALMLQYGFASTAAAAAGAKAKKVVFALDYSGSMAGSKINAAVDSLVAIYEAHLSMDDECMVCTFTSSVNVEIPTHTKKSANYRDKINSLRRPNGATAFFDAVDQSLKEIRSASSNVSTRWIVALTDGEDTSSRLPVSQLAANLKAETSLNGLIVIGVGSDVDQNLLQSLVHNTPQGMFLFAAGDKQSISVAFQQVVEIIRGEVVLEDF